MILRNSLPTFLLPTFLLSACGEQGDPGDEAADSTTSATDTGGDPEPLAKPSLS